MIELVPVARDELKEAILYYEDAQTGLGDRFNRAVDAVIEAIAQSPSRFAKYEGNSTRREYRRALLSGFPYLIVYQVRSELIRIVAVAHSSRAPGYWEGR